MIIAVNLVIVFVKYNFGCSLIECMYSHVNRISPVVSRDLSYASPAMSSLVPCLENFSEGLLHDGKLDSSIFHFNAPETSPRTSGMLCEDEDCQKGTSGNVVF